MRKFYVKIDTNDADYIGKLVDVEDEDVEKWLPLIEKIKNFKPYIGESKSGSKWTHSHNFPYGDVFRDDLGEKGPCELYNITEDELYEFIETFSLYGGEYGFHTITEITEINIVKRIL